MNLVELIEHHGFPIGRQKAEAVADAIRRATTITTVEELDNLTDGSIIESRGNVGRTQRHTISSLNGGNVHLDKHSMLPACVIYEPGDES